MGPGYQSWLQSTRSSRPARSASRHLASCGRCSTASVPRCQRADLQCAAAVAVVAQALAAVGQAGAILPLRRQAGAVVAHGDRAAVGVAADVHAHRAAGQGRRDAVFDGVLHQRQQQTRWQPAPGAGRVQMQRGLQPFAQPRLHDLQVLADGLEFVAERDLVATEQLGGAAQEGRQRAQQGGCARVADVDPVLQRGQRVEDEVGLDLGLQQVQARLRHLARSGVAFLHQGHAGQFTAILRAAHLGHPPQQQQDGHQRHQQQWRGLLGRGEHRVGQRLGLQFTVPRQATDQKADEGTGIAHDHDAQRTACQAPHGELLRLQPGPQAGQRHAQPDQQRADHGQQPGEPGRHQARHAGDHREGQAGQQPGATAAIEPAVDAPGLGGQRRFHLRVMLLGPGEVTPLPGIQRAVGNHGGQCRQHRAVRGDRCGERSPAAGRRSPAGFDGGPRSRWA